MGIEKGKKYINIHTGIVCEVRQKIFFNIQYFNADDTKYKYPRYCHYKRFQKNWKVMIEQKTKAIDAEIKRLKGWR